MIFESRFELGDVVYTIDKRYAKIPCSLCKGVGDVEAIFEGKPYTFHCPKCKGLKYVSAPSPIWMVREVEHSGISPLSPTVEAEYVIKGFFISEEDIELIATVTNKGNVLRKSDADRIKKRIKETMAFSSKEEAQKRCDELNRQDIEDGKK